MVTRDCKRTGDASARCYRAQSKWRALRRCHVVLYKPISVERVVRGPCVRNRWRESVDPVPPIPVEIQASVKSERIGTVEVLVDLMKAAQRLIRRVAGKWSAYTWVPTGDQRINECNRDCLERLQPVGVRFVDIPTGSRGT
jgi:hypothetical protein